MSTGSMAAGLIDNRWRIHPLQRIFSFPAMLACLLAVLAVLTVRARFDDPDMWWHLKMGEVIWTTRSIPVTDIFSYTTEHHAYVPHEWLSQWLIYGAYRLAGYTGLMLWLCGMSAALLIAGYGLCWVYSGNAKVALVGALTVWLFSTIGLAVRPQVVGYLLLIIELVVLRLGSTRDARWFFGLPLLFMVWVNCHGSFAVGLAVAGAVLVCSFFDFEMAFVAASRWEPQRRWMLAQALALSIGALFLNPVGTKQVIYPIDTMLNQPINLSATHEWFPLQFDDGRAFALVGIVAGVPLIAAVRRKQLHLHELALVAMGAWLAAQHRRMMFVFGILVAPILTRLLADAWDDYSAERDLPVANAVMIAVSAAIVFLAFPNRQMLASQVDRNSPAKAVEYLKAHPVQGNMLNEYGYGGYLIWAAPEHPVFIDGRADIFEETGVMRDFGNWAMLESDPRELLEKYKVDFCLLSRGAPMARVLPLMRWKTIYSDENAVILVRGDGADSRER